MFGTLVSHRRSECLFLHFMNRLERLNAILVHLQSKRIVRASELADRFDISLRTVYRDIRALEQAGIPIGAEAGTGYYLMEHFHLDPVAFSLSEASALLLGEKLMERLSDDATREHYRSAICKIRAILKPAAKDYLESLSDSISVINWSHASPEFRKLYLPEIQQAIAEKRVIEIQYQAKYSGEETRRNVEPIGLCNYDSRWHLIAWCRLRNRYRDFRLDRILKLNLTNETFSRQKHITMDEYFEQFVPDDTFANITLRIQNEKAHNIEESKFWYGFLSEEAQDGQHLLLHFANPDLQGFSRWIIASGTCPEIISPPELAELIQRTVSDLSEAYLHPKNEQASKFRDNDLPSHVF